MKLREKQKSLILTGERPQPKPYKIADLKVKGLKDKKHCVKNLGS